jgi:hypothetical protein
MIKNYDKLFFFFNLIKKRTGPDLTVDRPVPSHGGPAPGGQWWDGLGFFKFGPLRTSPYRPWTVDRPGL